MSCGMGTTTGTSNSGADTGVGDVSETWRGCCRSNKLGELLEVIDGRGEACRTTTEAEAARNVSSTTAVRTSGLKAEAPRRLHARMAISRGRSVSEAGRSLGGRLERSSEAVDGDVVMTRWCSSYRAAQFKCGMIRLVGVYWN